MGLTGAGGRGGQFGQNARGREGGQFGQNAQKLLENYKICISESKEWGAMGSKPIFQAVGRF